MGLGYGTSAGAGAGADALQDLLKRKFLEQISNQKLAEEQRQADMQNRIQQGQLGLGQQRIDQEGKQFDQKLGQDSSQFNTTSGFKGRELAMEEGLQPVRIKNMAATTGHLDAETADIQRKPTAEQAARDFATGRDATQHKYQMGEIGAQGANALRVANVSHPTGPTAQQQNEVDDSLALVNEIRNDPALAHSVGPLEGRGAGMATAGPEGYTRVKALHDNLVNKLQLAQAGKLKGQGQISNMEREMLKSAATALDRTLGDADYLNQLTKVEQQFQRMKGGGAAPAAAPGGGGMMRARDPQGNLHEAPAGTPLPAGWKLE